MADSQLNIFDAIAANQLAEAGIERAGHGKGAVLELAKRGAVEIARTRGTVTADDVQQWLVNKGIDEGELGNAAGSVFRGNKAFICVGTEMSKRPAAHRRLIRIWKLI